MSTTSPCCWCDPLPCRQALDRSQSQSKLRCSPCIGKKLATDPGILLSFLPSEKPQKRRKRSHTNVSNTLVARPLTPPAQTPQRSFQQASAGVLLSSANRLICLKYAEGAPHTARGKPFPKRFQITLAQTPQRLFQGAAAGTHATPAPNRAHSGLHGETVVFRMGALSLPSERFARFGNPARPGLKTANFAAFGSWPGALPKNAESLRDSDALMRAAVTRRRGPAGLRDPIAVSLTALIGFTVLADRDYRVRKKAHFVLCAELFCQLCLRLPPLCCTL